MFDYICMGLAELLGPRTKQNSKMKKIFPIVVIEPRLFRNYTGPGDWHHFNFKGSAVRAQVWSV